MLLDLQGGPLADNAHEQLLPSMTAAAFCRRTVANLANFHNSSSTSLLSIDRIGLVTDPKPPLAVAPIVQLGALFFAEFERVFDTLVMSEFHHNEPMARLYTRIVGARTSVSC